MTYPPSPDDVAPNRVRPDSTQFWAGGVATAVVAALIALVGILVCRWAMHIPILAPASDGTWGDAHTGEYVLVAAVIALVATGLLYLLVLAAPEPDTFFRWIMGLARRWSTRSAPVRRSSRRPRPRSSTWCSASPSRRC